MARRLLAIVLGSALLAGCGGGDSPGQRAATAKTPTSTPAITGLPGRLVPIGGGRSLFMHCVGSGSPTVVLEAGFGGSNGNWLGVQPAMGHITRTCAYDRAGLGSSVGLPGVHDARDEIADLQRLLSAAHLPPPYVLVGHSYGGLLARLYARAHPDQVGGLVLVDSMGRDQTRRTLAVWPRSVAPAARRRLRHGVVDGVDLGAGERLAARIRTLGDMPLAVVTAGRHDAEWGDLPRRLGGALDRLWTGLQDELAALSSDHVHVVALRSDHFVQGADGQPGVVVRAVRAVVTAARDHASLPPCPALFHGAGVRCRP